MKKNKIKLAFTLTEMVMVIAIIWILMMWMTVYISWSSERTKIIEAEWCASSFWWIMDNYLFYALTSRILYSWNSPISPNYYYIQLTWGTSSSDNSCISSNFTWDNPIFCNEIVLWYSTWNLWYSENPAKYQSLTIQNTCRQNQSKIWFYRKWLNDSDNIHHIKMNKWFSPTSITDQNVFYLEKWPTNDKLLLAEIMVVLCSDDECSWHKDVAKWVVDARSQTISLKKCKFYEEDDPTTCMEREN